MKPLKSRHDHVIVEAYSEIYDELKSRGLQPKLQHLDNEEYKALKKFFDAEKVEYQLTTPHIHQRRSGEIHMRRVFKNRPT